MNVKILPIAAGLAGATWLGLSAAAAAHDEAQSERKEIRRIIIVKDGPGGEHVDRRIEEFRRDREVAMSRCTGERSEIDERTDSERTRIVVCADDLGADDRAKRLEETLGRIRKDEHLSAEHKAKVETALEQAIAKLRETN